MAETPEKTVINNHDVAGLCNRISRYAEEVFKSGSSQVPLNNQDDLDRLDRFLGSCKKYKAFVVKQPILDLPKSSPRDVLIEDAFKKYKHVDNEDVNDIIGMLFLLYNELANGVSARMPSTLHPDDAVRFDKTMAKIEAFIKDYVVVTNPLDMPETSPHAESSGTGTVGV